MEVQRLPVFAADHTTVVSYVYVLIKNNKVVSTIADELDRHTDSGAAAEMFAMNLGDTP